MMGLMVVRLMVMVRCGPSAMRRLTAKNPLGTKAAYVPEAGLGASHATACINRLDGPRLSTSTTACASGVMSGSGHGSNTGYGALLGTDTVAGHWNLWGPR
ncbi:hypothetical protein Vretimale_2899 [Volvox reticuliferus]|uniref:Uncharacterized protein n=1 Tax=Volvox reticuliferus TaxID=1737510 RepID=A0A8J4G370_9CHLO|nr:hypothetical protein Vretifemale_1710 [Volvox reticuliferus]GIL97163.1 hypothetical protein Vretimale_2899 [Volvox reticuliferus]